jgi:hypothetical protein
MVPVRTESTEVWGDLESGGDRVLVQCRALRNCSSLMIVPGLQPRSETHSGAIQTEMGKSMKIDQLGRELGRLACLQRSWSVGQLALKDAVHDLNGVHSVRSPPSPTWPSSTWALWKQRLDSSDTDCCRAGSAWAVLPYLAGDE